MIGRWRLGKHIGLLAIVLSCLLPSGGLAQYTEIEANFRRLSPDQVVRLREVLAEPVPDDMLYESQRRLFTEKSMAAVRLGDARAREEVLRQAASRLPDAAWKMDLGAILLARGDIEQGNHWRALALRAAPNPQVRALYTAFIARDLALQFDDKGAAVKLTELQEDVRNQVATVRASWEKLQLRRASAHGAMVESVLAQRVNKHEAAIRAAHEAEDHARSAWGMLSDSTDPNRPLLATDIGLAVSRLLEAQRAARRYEDAERTLNSYVRLSRQLELSPEQMADMYLHASQIRFDRRMFTDAVELAQKSDGVLAQLGIDAMHPARLERSRAMIIALIGQGSTSEASKAFDRLDELAGDDEALRRRANFPLERGLVYLDTEREVEASALFADLAAETAHVLGPEHFFVVQSRGLQAVALWRADSKASRDEAIPLLHGVMQQMMAPANVDYVEKVGLRIDIRNRIAETYLESISEIGGDEALAALQVADWIQTGVVREAVEDAATRSAAANPAIARLVRQDQELRNEIRALRKYLDGSGGLIDSLLPELANKTRDRIDALNQQRGGLHARIKARLPDYEQMVRPRPASMSDIAGGLAGDEAVALLLPTERAVYAWAVGADGRAAFHREALTRFELNQLVHRLRRTLDFNEMGDRLLAFDKEAAAELHARLLTPLDAVLRGKKHLIVASSGSLAEIPFGVLISEAYRENAGTIPWLIRSAALSHQPSISAWLALRRGAHGAVGQEPLMGWGDPAFARVPPPARYAALASVSEASVGAVELRRVLRRNVFVKRAMPLTLGLEDPGASVRYGEIPPLPDTRDELRAIAGTLRANEATDLKFGAAATRESVLAASQSGLLARKRVVAFATHGLMADDLPHLTQPALALAATGKEAEDPLAPLLTLDDVMSLRLNADWVLLSACNTAASDGSAAEALSGLARGFFFAGARSILATYWAVESESAKLLTAATFAHYVANVTARKSESLRQAMLGVMAKPDFDHPAFWAAYALVGDGGR